MENCFARKGNDCGALECGCPGFSECSFYRTQAQMDESRQKAFERIKRLPYLQQVYIATTYHGGKMPWKEKADVSDV